MAECPVCKTAIANTAMRFNENRVFPGAVVECPRCGEFTLIGATLDMLAKAGDSERHRRAITSHATRRMQRAGANPPELLEDDLRAIWRENRLPTPQQQCDLFVLLLGRLQPSWSEPISIASLRLDAEIGAALTSAGQPGGSEWIADYLRNQRLVQCQPPVVGVVQPSLTPTGWLRYEELQRQSSDSRTAFMAMKFGRPRSDTMFRDHFIPAVKATGFDLHRLDTRPRAGLIDARMEVDIRTARFLIADLTHGNRGAYWEAGLCSWSWEAGFLHMRRGLFQAE